MGLRSGTGPEIAPRKPIQARRAKRAKASAVSQSVATSCVRLDWPTVSNWPLAVTTGLIDLFLLLEERKRIGRPKAETLSILNRVKTESPTAARSEARRAERCNQVNK